MPSWLEVPEEDRQHARRSCVVLAAFVVVVMVAALFGVGPTGG